MLRQPGMLLREFGASSHAAPESDGDSFFD
jgi:hypothetical protein